MAGLQYLLEHHMLVLFESTQPCINQMELSDLLIVICPGRADSGEEEVPSFRKICETPFYYLRSR